MKSRFKESTGVRRSKLSRWPHTHEARSFSRRHPTNRTVLSSLDLRVMSNNLRRFDLIQCPPFGIVHNTGSRSFIRRNLTRCALNGRTTCGDSHSVRCDVYQSPMIQVVGHSSTRSTSKTGGIGEQTILYKARGAVYVPGSGLWLELR